MKPAFALDFRDETISLSHRTGSGWQIVGSIPMDAPDLSEALSYLRATALGLSPRGLTTKLIIPNEQILYTEAFAPGPDSASRRQQIEASLEGRTPYDVADLVYDVSGDGQYVKVAVIAKETLAEAEAFAVEHRFNPISFAAAPDGATFDGEAWFGATTLAASLLPTDDHVEPDLFVSKAVVRSVYAEPDVEPRANDVDVAAPEEVVQETTAEGWREDDQTPEDFAEPTVEAETIDMAAHLAEPDAYDGTHSYPAEGEPAAADAFADLPPEDVAELDAYEPATEVAAPEPEHVPEVPATEDLQKDDHGSTDHELIAALADTLATPIVQPAPPAPKPPAIKILPDVEEAPMALDVADDDAMEDEPQGAGVIKAALSAQANAAKTSIAEPAGERSLSDTAKRVIDPAIDDDVPALPSEATRLAFASRRQEDEPPHGAPSLGAAKPGIARPAAAKPLAAAAPRGGAKPGASEKAAKAGKSALRGLTSLVNGAATKPRSKVSIPSALPPLRTSDGATRPQQPVQRPAAARANGGFPTRPVTRGKPRYLGIIMTVVLLFLLAMIAAWSSYSLGAWNFGTENPVQTVAADPAPTASAEVPTPEDEIAADGQDTEGVASPDQPESLALDANAAEVNQPQLSAATPNDEIMLSTMDAPPVAPDPLSLPAPDARGDPLPSAQPAPPPFGTVYQFAANGTIEPTPKGIITPEGVLLRAGKPPQVPVPRPTSVVAAFTAAHPVGGDPTTKPVAAEGLPPAVYADPALAGKKPLPRPAGLSSPAAEQGSLAPAVDSRLAGLRPQPRPASILSAGKAAQKASAGASLTAQAEADTQEAALTGGSKLAIAISRKPMPRPRDLSRAVEAAVAAAVRQPVAEPEPAPEPTPEPAAAAKPEQKVAAADPGKDAGSGGDSEPEVTSAAPKIPTKSSVAKLATFKNAINLSKINLIGVYGSQSKRYALVRTAAGRYKKVKVGDTIDGGGRVAAITSSEVRYQKGGRLIALQMPKE